MNNFGLIKKNLCSIIKCFIFTKKTKQMELFKNTIREAIKQYDFSQDLDGDLLDYNCQTIEVYNEALTNDTLILELTFDFRAEIVNEEVHICEDLNLRRVNLFIFLEDDTLQFNPDDFHDALEESLIDSLNSEICGR